MAANDLTITFTEELVVLTCWCGINHAVPRNLRAFQERQHRDGEKVTPIWCPLGHTHQPAGEGKAAQLARELERTERRARARLDALEAERRSHSATKGQLTKTRKRIGKGVCPCCNRHFSNVQRHMERQHPELSEPLSPA
jgi:hypothetical protein